MVQASSLKSQCTIHKTSDDVKSFLGSPSSSIASSTSVGSLDLVEERELVLACYGQEKSAFEMNRDHALLMKRAERRKEIIMLVLFAVSTGAPCKSSRKIPHLGTCGPLGL